MILRFQTQRSKQSVKPCHEKTFILGFRPGPTQTQLYNRPVYIESCACVVKDAVKCSFECLSVAHHTCLIQRVGVGDGEMIK